MSRPVEKAELPLLEDVFTYAIRGGGKFVLIIGGVLMMGAKLAVLGGPLGLIAIVFLMSYFNAIFWDNIMTTAGGSEECDGFPDITDLFGDLIAPFIKTILVMILSFFPYFVWIIWGDGNLLIDWALFFAGAAYFPMALMGLVVLGTFRAVSPHIVIPAIFRSGFTYWIAFGLLVLTQFSESYVETWLTNALPSSVLTTYVMIPALMCFVAIYTLMTSGRVLGLIYLKREDEIGWV